MATKDLRNDGAQTNDVEPPELWPATYPPQGEDAETPWLPTDPIPNTEPDVPSLESPDPAMYKM